MEVMTEMAMIIKRKMDEKQEMAKSVKRMEKARTRRRKRKFTGIGARAKFGTGQPI